MNSERWARIKAVYHSALDLEPERREAYLKEVCAGDEGLFKEVASLLANEGSSQDLFDSPALNAVARALAEDDAHRPRPNLIGQTLSHYRIEKKIGEGGMGEVFLAQDTSLDRKVALKLLPPEMQQDPVARKRFLREARSAAALDNPFICSIHEVGESEGKDFIVMEYVDGQTLAGRLRRGRLPLNQALQIAMEVAEAIQTAHGRGIVHRDLKPSNIMLTKTGHAKVMDFGLAKEIIPSSGTESRDESITAMTRSGMTLGTLAYMSPEQVKGQAVDARSDIFSFGLVLYEMLTGTHPFRKENPMETASAILHEEAKPVGEIAKGIPIDLEKLVTRCLRREAERRIQHAGDVKLALDEIKADLEAGRQHVLPVAARKIGSVPLAAGVMAIFALGALAAVALYWRISQRTAEPESLFTSVPLTSYAGYEVCPTFSPDGNSVAFQRLPEGPGANSDIYIKQIGVEPPFRLTADPANDISPAWSPDGRFIAFLRQVPGRDWALLIVPPIGGRERVLVESGVPVMDEEDPNLAVLAWTPDSKWVVFPWRDAGGTGPGLFLLSVETLEKRRLTERRDESPAFSPDGRSLVFARWHADGIRTFLLRLGTGYQPDGVPVRVPAGGSFFCWSSAWTPDGREIISSCSSSFDGSSIWRMEASGSAKPQRIPVPSEEVGSLALSRQGDRLVYMAPRYRSSIWAVGVDGRSQPPGAPSVLIESTRSEWHPAYSPDGKRIAFSSERSGHLEIWVCGRDGSNAVQLTHSLGDGVYGPNWSPDGRSIAFEVTTRENTEVCVMSADGGAPRRVKTATEDRSPWPCWSRDGQSIYFRSIRSGSSEIWNIPARGGDAVQITRNGGDLPQPSPDGESLYFMKAERFPERCSIWRTTARGGEETRVIDSTACIGPYAVWGQGIYFFSEADEKDRHEIRFYDFASGNIHKLLTVEQRIMGWIATSPDGKTILYTKTDESGSDLMLMENFR